jgi:hypothetical protein
MHRTPLRFPTKEQMAQQFYIDEYLENSQEFVNSGFSFAHPLGRFSPTDEHEIGMLEPDLMSLHNGEMVGNPSFFDGQSHLANMVFNQKVEMGYIGRMDRGIRSMPEIETHTLFSTDRPWGVDGTAENCLNRTKSWRCPLRNGTCTMDKLFHHDHSEEKCSGTRGP